jgi:hypothetical protein
MNVHSNVFIDIKELKLNERGIKIIIGTVSQKSPIYIKNSTTFYKNCFSCHVHSFEIIFLKRLILLK